MTEAGADLGRAVPRRVSEPFGGMWSLSAGGYLMNESLNR